MDWRNPIDTDALKSAATGAAEAGANLVSGGIMAPLAGGLAYIPASLAGGDPAGQSVMRDVSQAFTYEPVTDAGKRQVADRQGMMAPVHESIGGAMSSTADASASAARAVGFGEKGQAVAYAAGKAAIPAALSSVMMMRGGSVIGSSKNVSFHAGRIKEGGAPVSEFSDAVLRQNGEANRYGPGLYSYADRGPAGEFANEIMAGTLKSQKSSAGASGSGKETAHIYRLNISPNNKNTISAYKTYGEKEIADISRRAEPNMPGISQRLRPGMDGDQILGEMQSVFESSRKGGLLAKPKPGEAGPRTMRNDALVKSGYRYIEGKIPNPASRSVADTTHRGIIVLSPQSGGVKIIDSFSVYGAASAVIAAPGE